MRLGAIPFSNYLGFLPAAARDLHREFWSRVFELDYVPQEWKDLMAAQLSANPNDYFRLIPPYVLSGAVSGEVPEFLDTPEKLRSWDLLQKHQQETLLPIINKWAGAARVLYVDQMRSKARWDAIRDAAITAAVFVRDLPANVATAAGEIASKTAVAGLAAFLPFLLIAGLGVVAFVAARSKLRE